MRDEAKPAPFCEGSRGIVVAAKQYRCFPAFGMPLHSGPLSWIAISVSVNGIPIKAMAAADMIAVVAAPTASTFGIIGVGEVKLR